MKMDQRVSLITLGVDNMEASAKFYEALGWERVETQDGVVAFDLIGQTLGLYPRAGLEEDLGLEPGSLSGSAALSLGYNVREKEDVAKILAMVEPAGGKVAKEAQDVFWGGHHGYFTDLDGHLWEVAHNPFSPLGDDGAFRWNGYS